MPGVGDITYLGQRDYSMRVWLDPQKLAAYNLIAQDVIQAVRRRISRSLRDRSANRRRRTARYRSTSLPRSAAWKTPNSSTISSLRTTTSLVYIKDVANIELGAPVLRSELHAGWQPSVALSVYQLPGSNALDVAQRVKERMKELKEYFPPGFDYSIVYDTTPFIKESISRSRRDVV